MAGELKIENLDALSRAVQKRIDRLDVGFRAAVKVEVRRIKDRTKSGEDVDGVQFRKYSDSWRRYRLKNDKQVKHVDLTFSGDMLNSLGATFARDGNNFVATVLFSGSHENMKARENQVTLKRKFLGFSKEQLQIISYKLRNVS